MAEEIRSAGELLDLLEAEGGFVTYTPVNRGDECYWFRGGWDCATQFDSKPVLTRSWRALVDRGVLVRKGAGAYHSEWTLDTTTEVK